MRLHEPGGPTGLKVGQIRRWSGLGSAGVKERFLFD